MSKHQISQIDIITVLLIALCIITVNLLTFTWDTPLLKDIFSILLLFIPGYSLLIVIFPINRYNIIKKALSSFLISLGLLSLIIVLKNTVLTSATITESNLSILLSSLTITFVILAYIRRKNLGTPESKKLILCKKCGGYYELQNGESLRDFERCQCGGELYTINYDIITLKTKKSIDAPTKAKIEVSDYLTKNILPIFLITILSIVSVSIPQLSGSIIRILSVSVLIFFLLGYTLTSIIFPLNRKMNKIKRFVLSVLFSVAFVLLLYTIFTINQTPISSTVSVLIFSIITILLAITAMIKMSRSPKKELDLFYTASAGKYEPKTLTKDLTEEKLEKTSIHRSQHTFLDLTLIFLVSILCLVFELAVPYKSFVESIFGLLFILFLPGYCLIAIVFPRKEDIEVVEREAFSFGLSTLIAPIIGLILNYTSSGINLTSLLIALAVVTIIMEIPAYITRQKVPEGDRFNVEFKHYFKKKESKRVKGR